MAEATDDRHPVWLLLDRMQMDLRQQQARMVELRAQIVALKLEAPPALSKCPDCDQSCRSVVELQEHRYHHHDGALPDLWVAADRLVGVDA